MQLMISFGIDKRFFEEKQIILGWKIKYIHPDLNDFFFSHIIKISLSLSVFEINNVEMLPIIE